MQRSIHFLVLVVMLVGSGLVHADVSLSPVDDRSGRTENGGGAFTTLYSQSDTLLYVNHGTNLGRVERSALEFDISGITATVRSATLNLGMNSRGGGSSNITIHGYAGDGVITLADLIVDNQILGPLDAYDSGDFAQFNTLDVTAYVQSIAGSANYAGFMLRGDNFTNVDFLSDEGTPRGTTVIRPTLTIDAIPEPGSGVICVAFAALALMRSRRRPVA